MRYQYLEELVTDREKAVFALRAELERVQISIDKLMYNYSFNLVLFQYKQWSAELDAGRLPEGFQALLEELGMLKQE